MTRKLMTKADTKLLLAIILLSLFVFALLKFYATVLPTERQVVIKVSGEVVKKISLQEGTHLQKITIEGKKGPAIIEIKGWKVRMVEAFCPDKLCVKQGWISNPGQSIICVPNEVVLYFDAAEANFIDAITH